MGVGIPPWYPLVKILCEMSRIIQHNINELLADEIKDRSSRYSDSNLKLGTEVDKKIV